MSQTPRTPFSSQSTVTKRSSVCTACTSTKVQQLLACGQCSESIHLGCVLKQFKESKNEPLKNRIEWLYNFTTFSSLIYHCKTCAAKGTIFNELQTVTKDYEKSISALDARMSKDIQNVKQSIEALDIKLSNILTSISLCNGGDGNSKTKQLTSTNVNDSIKVTSCTGLPASITYAQIMTKNISDVVKTAVADSMRKQRKNDSDRSSIVLFGLQERKEDLKKVKLVLDPVGCDSKVVKIARLGASLDKSQHQPNGKNSEKQRPLKVELSSEADSRYVLMHSKLLKSNPKFAKVRKTVRIKCDELNKNCSADENGRKPFVVWSSKIMKRDSNGKFSIFQDDAGLCNTEANANLQASAIMDDKIKPSSESQPKNG